MSSDIETVEVDLADRRYAIRVGAGLIASADRELADLADGRQVVVIADEGLAGRHLEALDAALRRGPARRVDTLTTPAGESGKTFARYEDLAERVAQLEAKLTGWIGGSEDSDRDGEGTDGS